MDSRLVSLREAWDRALAVGPVDVAACIGLARAVGFMESEALQAAAGIAMGAVLSGQVEVGDTDDAAEYGDLLTRFERWDGDQVDHAGKLARVMIAAAGTRIEPHDVATFRLVHSAVETRIQQGDQMGAAALLR